MEAGHGDFCNQKSRDDEYACLKYYGGKSSLVSEKKKIWWEREQVEKTK